MNKAIKLAFHSAVYEATKEMVISKLSDNFNPIISKEYDYYFAMESIYWSRANMLEFLHSDKEAIRIMLCGEAVYPDMNLFDYAWWNCDFYNVQDRIIRIPLMAIEKGYLFDSLQELDDSKLNLNPRDVLKEKTKFCNFIYGNARAHDMRDAIFYAISDYKKVDSLGMHLKNVEVEDTRNNIGWEKISVKLKAPYKFSIAAENAMFPGYTTEKIMTSMMANTIPIYWGDPYVDQYFNSASFINVSKFENLNELVNYIRQVDEDDDLYCEIMSQPWRTKEQIDKCNYDIEAANRAFCHIFELNKEKAKRRPRGCWPESIYASFFELNNIQAKNKRLVLAIEKFKKSFFSK